MNRVGHQGKGKSVWLAWFLCSTPRKFAALATQRGAADDAARRLAHAAGLQAAAESQAGGGAWYRRAYFAAGWMYRTGLESLPGVTERGDVLHVAPCIPPRWPGYRVLYRHGATEYAIGVENRKGAARGVAYMELDGMRLENPELV